ncbi:ammonium transporter [Luteimonas viscosa]|uniref:Ammonium transporter n=1 Tax=Luteimonas viscosa TaxID=1132694 RepID=A0A5D4XPJ1_9GAMM|nr:ammonium transporter [Luteimonas viscosa]TYT26587.1 ammonium transporter [Luteimonas viscosa]
MNRELTGYIAWAVGIIAVALVASYARKLGHIDQDTTTRVVIGLNGLMIAWIGNRMPKAVAPSAAIRQVRRVGGWSMVLSGLVYAGLWTFAPIPVAVAGGCAAIILGIAVTSVYCLKLRNKANATVA